MRLRPCARQVALPSGSAERDHPWSAPTHTTWEAAIDHVAQRLRLTRDAYGPNSIAFLTSAKCTNEENYLMQKLARGLIGTNNIDHCARL